MPLFTLSRAAPPSLSDQIALFQNLARFMKSGIPVAAGLAHAEEQASGKMRPILEAIRLALEVRRVPLAEAFRDNYPGGDPFLMALLEQGEASGTLEASFRQMEENAKRRLDRLRQLAREMAYPCLCLLAFLVLWPIPKLISGGLEAYLVRAIPPLVVIGVAAWAWLTIWPRVRLDPGLARQVDATLLAMPVIGKPVRAAVMARFGRALGMLLRSGIALDRALALAGDASGSPMLALRLKAVASEVRRGQPLSELLAPLGDILSKSFIGMVKTGEQTGELDTMLEQAAELHEQDARSAVDVSLKLAGPLLTIAVAGGIGVYIVNTYAAIWSGYEQILH